MQSRGSYPSFGENPVIVPNYFVRFSSATGAPGQQSLPHDTASLRPHSLETTVLFGESLRGICSDPVRELFYVACGQSVKVLSWSKLHYSYLVSSASPIASGGILSGSSSIEDDDFVDAPARIQRLRLVASLPFNAADGVAGVACISSPGSGLALEHEPEWLGASEAGEVRLMRGDRCVRVLARDHLPPDEARKSFKQAHASLSLLGANAGDSKTPAAAQSCPSAIGRPAGTPTAAWLRHCCPTGSAVRSVIPPVFGLPSAGEPSPYRGFVLPGLSHVRTDGRLFVSRHYAHCVEVYDKSGRYLYSFGMRGSRPGQFQFPSGISVTPHDTLLVCDSMNHRVQEFTLDGHYISSLGTGGSLPGQFMDPTAVCVDAEGNYVITDTGNHRVQVLMPHHRVGTAVSPSTLSAHPFVPFDVVPGWCGGLAVTDVLQHSIVLL